ncbi:hypothetical protein ACTFIZ_011780 [Dictyostelium cf. discoideum]
MIIEKGKMTAFFGNEEQYLQPFHSNITVLNKSNFTRDNVVDICNPSSDNDSELREAQATLFNSNSISGYVLLNYVGPSTVHFISSGEGFDGIADKLKDDQIQYGLVRIGDIQERGVGIIEKGKKTAFLGDAQQYLQPFHADITVLNKSHFTRDNVLDICNPSSGSQVIE